MLHIATNAHQQTSVNNFAKESQHGTSTASAASTPTRRTRWRRWSASRRWGCTGIKLHPDYQEFFIGDEGALPIYAQAEKLGLPIAFHTGRDPLSPNLIHCPADVLGKIADLFPRLTIIAAHMGGMDTPQEAAKHLAGKKNVYFDTAFASHFLDAASFTQLVKLHGADKVLFATDCPWSTLPGGKGFAGGGGPIPQREGAHRSYRNAEELFGVTV